MALTDTLRGGESYFVVEIRSLKRICDASEDESPVPVLAFIDEVLRALQLFSGKVIMTEDLSHFLCYLYYRSQHIVSVKYTFTAAGFAFLLLFRAEQRL